MGQAGVATASLITVTLSGCKGRRRRPVITSMTGARCGGGQLGGNEVHRDILRGPRRTSQGKRCRHGGGRRGWGRQLGRRRSGSAGTRLLVLLPRSLDNRAKGIERAGVEEVAEFLAIRVLKGKRQRGDRVRAV
jgi:hypothetical protein